MLKRLKKIVSLTLATVMMFAMSTNALAAGSDFNSIVEENKVEIERALQDIIEYSTYDAESGIWNLDYAIVEDGVFTERQYEDAEAAGRAWMQVEEKNADTIAQDQRALPALLILAIKAVGAIAGAAIVTEMTNYFLTWGLTAGCE